MNRIPGCAKYAAVWYTAGTHTTRGDGVHREIPGRVDDSYWGPRPGVGVFPGVGVESSSGNGSGGAFFLVEHSCFQPSRPVSICIVVDSMPGAYPHTEVNADSLFFAAFSCLLPTAFQCEPWTELRSIKRKAVEIVFSEHAAPDAPCRVLYRSSRLKRESKEDGNMVSSSRMACACIDCNPDIHLVQDCNRSFRNRRGHRCTAFSRHTRGRCTCRAG